MVVKVFCGEELSRHEHEYKQFKEIYDIINDKYANTEELIYILANFNLSNAQIDVLILTEKGTAILELKSFKGKIIGSENGDWKVITEIGKEEKLPKNLFRQLRDQKFAFLEKFNIIRIGNFERIEENKLAKIKCWGYFEKGSNYNIKQVGKGVHIWFDVITSDNIIEKLKFVDADYILLPTDMDAIVKGLKLKKYPGFESIEPIPPPKVPEKLESLLKIDKFQWVKHDLLPLFGLLNFSDDRKNGFFTLPLSKENLIYNLERVSGKHPTRIDHELSEFEEAFKEYIDIKNGDYIYVSDSGISKGRHPPSRNPCEHPNDSTKYYILKREIDELSEQELRNIQAAPQEIFITRLSTVRTVEDLLYLVVLKKISEKCKSPNYYHYFGETEPLKVAMEIANIDEEITKYCFNGDSEFKWDFEKMKNFFPADDKLFAIFHSHKFNLSSCHHLSNISIRSDIAQYFYDTLNKIDIEKNLRENYAKVKQKIIVIEDRLPLFEYKNEDLIFIKKYYDKLINSNRPFYTFEFEGHYGTVVERLEDRGIIDIKGDKVVLLSKDKLKALRDGLEKIELERIDRNKKELTSNWLKYGVNIQIEPPVKLPPITPDKGHENKKKSGLNGKADFNEQTETLKSILPEIPYEFLITFPPYAKDGVKVFGRNELKGKLAFGYEIEDSGNINYDKLLTIDLFDINQPHFGAFQQVRSGKSTLAGNIILQAAFQGLPVVIFDPKPDYVSNIISIQDTIESRPDHKEGIEPRFKETKQDIRGFDFTTKVPFDYDGKQWDIEFNIYSFDEKLRELPNCKVLKIPLVSLPQRDSQNFDEICDYIATNLADAISSGTKKKARGFNVLISKIIKQFSKEYSDRDVIFFDDFYNILDKPIQDSVEKKDKEKLEKLSEDLKVFQTSQSFIFAKNKNETLDMKELIKNPLDIDGDRKTVSISVIDISSLPQAKETPILRNYVSEVCTQIFNIVRKINVQKPVKLLVVFDEAQNYLPRPSDLYNSVRRILTGGASIGIKAWVIAQSPQNIEKEATKQLTTFICANVSQSTIQDDISKYVTDEKWTEKLRHTGLGRVLIFNKDMKPNGKLCLTFTTPQTVDLLTPTEIVDKSKNFFK